MTTFHCSFIKKLCLGSLCSLARFNFAMVRFDDVVTTPKVNVFITLLVIIIITNTVITKEDYCDF